MNNNIIFLDNAAHHSLLPTVQSKIIQTLPLLANPSSLHSMGVKLRNEIETAREKIARSLNCDTNEIIFTSGASESNSTIAYNFSKYFYNCDMCISPFEHDSVYGNYSCEYIDFHILVGNENGKDYSKILSNEHLFGVDATTALGNIRLDLNNPNFNFASFSGEKTGSISGSGLLYVNKEFNHYTPMVYGHQENNRRGGTENILGIIGMGISVPMAVANIEKKYEHCLKLKQTLLDELTGVDFICNSGDDCVPSIISLSFKGVDGMGLMTYLDTKGICISTGSACNSGNIEPSKVLKALGVPIDYINGTIRISTSLNNTIDEIKYTAEKIRDYIKEVV